MADTQYVPLGEEDAPAGWTLPAQLQIIPKIAYATFDGTNAAGSFQPCLRLVSDSGHVAAECVGGTVAAGGSADVTWFRGVGGTATVPITTTALPWAYISGSGAKTCPASSTTQLSGVAANFYTNTSALFDTAANVSGNTGIRLLGNGHFLSVVTAGPSSLPGAGANYEIAQLGGGAAAGFEWPPTNVLFPSGATTDQGRVVEGLLMTVGGGISAPTIPIVPEIINSGSVSVSLDYTGLMVIQLDSNATDLN